LPQVARIAIVHSRFEGHLRPALRLTLHLVRQGHEVISWARRDVRAHVERVGSVFVEQEPGPTRWPRLSVLAAAVELMHATEVCVASFTEQLLQRDIDLVIHDCHAPWGLVAAEFLGVPRIVSDPLFPGSWARANASPARASTRHHRLPAEIGEFTASRVRIGRRWGVDLGEWWEAVNVAGPLTAVYSTEHIVGAAKLPPGSRCLGPLLSAASRRTGPASWREHHHLPLVYVAFGTVYNNDRRAFRAALDGLADLPVEVIVSTGRGRWRADDLEPVPANARVHEFVNSRVVLAEAAAHVTHGGGGSVHESLVAGVPMVVLPAGSDHFDWSASVERLGAGVRGALDATAIADHVCQILGEPRWREAASAVAAHLAAFDGAGRVVELLTSVGVEPGDGQEVGDRSVSSDSERGSGKIPSVTGTS
jgi:MGT family glycosyltransferase